MKNKFVNKVILILIILGVICGLNNKCFAENTTNESLNTQASSKNETTKSSNANLSNLGIRPNDFTGFKYGTTTYNVTVPESTKSVEVYAEPQDSKAKVTGTGTKTLENTKTTVDVVVTAEDGTKKTYTINITKGKTKNESNSNEAGSTGKENKSNSEVNSNGLSSLKINELNLTPDFKTDIYEYNVKYIGEDTKLDIKAEPTQDDYIVEIAGNKDLKEGENIITILVSDKNAENIATYQITVNKSLIDEEAINKENSKKMLMIAGIIGAVLIVIIIVLLVKRKRDKEYEEEYVEDTIDELEENETEYEEDDDDDEQLPKAFRNKSKYEDKYEYEEMTKENARKKFLDGYNSTDYDYKEERTKTRHKGKRFK